MNELDSALKEYLETIKSLSQQPSEAELREVLSAAGWLEADIVNGLRYLKGASVQENPAIQPQSPAKSKAPVSEPVTPPSVPIVVTEPAPVTPSLDTSVEDARTQTAPASVPTEGQKAATPFWEEDLSSLEYRPQPPQSLESPARPAKIAPVEVSRPKPSFQTRPSVVPPQSVSPILRIEKKPLRTPEPVITKITPPRTPPPASLVVKPSEPLMHSAGSLQPPRPMSSVRSQSGGIPKVIVGTFPPRQGIAVSSSAESREGKGKGVIFIAGIIVALLVAFGAAYAYSKGMIRLGMRGAPLQGDAFWETLSLAVPQDKSTAFEAHVGITVVPRRPNAVPIPGVSLAEREKEERDWARYNKVGRIRGEINEYFKKNKKYPLSLEDAKISVDKDDSAFFLYLQKESGKGYTLDLLFESEQAPKWVDMLGTAPQNIQASVLSFSHPRNAQTASDPQSEWIADWASLKSRTEPFFADWFTWEHRIHLHTLTDVKIKGNTSPLATGGSQVEGHVEGPITFVDAMNREFRFSFLKRDGVLYFKRDELPGTVVRMHTTSKVADPERPDIETDPELIDGIESKWVRVEPEIVEAHGLNLTQIRNLPWGYGTRSNYRPLLEAVKTFLKVGLESGTFSLNGEGVLDKTKDGEVYKYSISSQPERVVSALSSLQKSQDLPWMLTELLKGAPNRSSLSYLLEQSTIDVWRDEKGELRGVRIAGSIIPPEVAIRWEGKQIDYEFSFYVDPATNVAVTKEPDFITFDDFMYAMSGFKKHDYLIRTQRSHISQVRFALESYKELMGEYPPDLESLLKNVRELGVPEHKLSKTFSARYFGGRPLLSYLPKDVYTQKVFEYSRNKSDFELRYTLVFPPPLYKDEISKEDLPFYSQFDEVRMIDHGSGKPFIHAAFVPGRNTATQSMLSKEAEMSKAVDADKDGVSDFLERHIGLNPSSADTDNDGENDFKEIIPGR